MKVIQEFKINKLNKGSSKMTLALFWARQIYDDDQNYKEKKFRATIRSLTLTQLRQSNL